MTRPITFATAFGLMFIPLFTALLVAAILMGAWKSAILLALDLVVALIFYNLFRVNE